VRKRIGLSIVLAVAPAVQAADVEAGKAKVAAVCAAQLGAEDMGNVAAYFASQPGPATGARSAFLPNLAKTGVTFPEGYKGTFTKYHTINFPATRQVRYYYANAAAVAVAAAKAGQPLPDGSVLFAEVYAARLGADDKPAMGGDGFFAAAR